jgi:hypothetical protein
MFPSGVSGVYQAGSLMFIALNNGQLVKVNPASPQCGGSNMFALTWGSDGVVGNCSSAYSVWQGTQVFGARVTGLMYTASDNTTTIGLSDGRMLKVAGTGGGGQNMFAVTQTDSGFATVPGYSYLLGSQKFASGVGGLYQIGGTTIVALEDITVGRTSEFGVLGNESTVTPATFNWSKQQLQDAALQLLTGFYAADGQLDRRDLLALFSDVAKDGTVSAAEFHDLQTLVPPGASSPSIQVNGSAVTVPDAVVGLARNVIYPNTANAHYQSATLGNLAAGSSGSQLQNLVNKWFLGLDHPVARSYDLTTTYAYQPVSGSLFQNGISYSDVVQGNISDCYFLTALSQTALRSPNSIRDMFTDNGDNTYTVRFWNNTVYLGRWEYVTVDNQLPANAYGYSVFAGWGGGSASNTANELWVALAEKAYAQINEEGWIGQDGTNSYNGNSTAVLTGTRNENGINFGFTPPCVTQITSLSGSGTLTLDLSKIQGALNSGKEIALYTNSTVTAGLIDGNNLVANHAYGLVGYDATTQLFTLYNPWGFTQKLTWQQIQDNFSGWGTTY